MLLGEFHSIVSLSVKRGDTLDTVIPGLAKMACQWMERNYSFKYMEQVRVLQVEQGIRTIPLQSNQAVKKISFVRMISSTGEYTYLKRASPRDFTSVTVGESQGYWLAGNHTIVLENVPGEPLVGEALFDCYTEWPTEVSETHPLLQTASDVMMYQVLMMLSAHMRDGRVFEAYKILRDEALNTLTRSEDELAYGGTDDAMAYIPYLPS